MSPAARPTRPPAKRRDGHRGTYRFWRDLGYAVGALVGGLVADLSGLNAAVIAAAAITAASGLLAARWITEPRRTGR